MHAEDACTRFAIACARVLLESFLSSPSSSLIVEKERERRLPCTRRCRRRLRARSLPRRQHNALGGEPVYLNLRPLQSHRVTRSSALTRGCDRRDRRRAEEETARVVFLARFVLIFPHLRAFASRLRFSLSFFPLFFSVFFLLMLNLWRLLLARRRRRRLAARRPVRTAGKCEFVRACVWHGRP